MPRRYNNLFAQRSNCQRYASDNSFSFHKWHNYAFGGFGSISSVMDFSTQRAITR